MQLTLVSSGLAKCPGFEILFLLVSLLIMLLVSVAYCVLLVAEDTVGRRSGYAQWPLAPFPLIVRTLLRTLLGESKVLSLHLIEISFLSGHGHHPSWPPGPGRRVEASCSRLSSLCLLRPGWCMSQNLLQIDLPLSFKEAPSCQAATRSHC